MLLSDVVACSDRVAGSRSRTAKATELAATLSAAGDQVGIVTAMLAGEVRQGRIGAGWRTLLAASSLSEASGSGPGSPYPGARDEVSPLLGRQQLTVETVDVALSEFCAQSGPGSVAGRRAVLADLLGAASDQERSFLVRLLGGELRHGALEGVLLDAISRASGTPAAAVRRAHMLSGSLPETALLALAGGEPALTAVRLEVGRPVHPMLASPGSSVASALATLGPDVLVEFKLDGARIQVHRRADQVSVFSRSLRDITADLPGVVEMVRELPCHTAVLDGEALTVDATGRPRPFQDTMSSFGAEQPADDPGPQPVFFDLLHLDGEDLLDRPLADRLGALGGLLSGRGLDAARMPGRWRPDAAQADAVLADSLARGHEGVLVKDLRSPYAAGRRGKAWQKVKPVRTLDLVVIGAEWGYGRRTGHLSNIHLGARDADGGPPVMVGKTFKGMTDALLRWQTATFPALVEQDRGRSVLLRPELVVEIAVDGAQRSTRYPGGVALRFARVVRYRPDKTAAEADTLASVRALLAG